MKSNGTKYRGRWVSEAEMHLRKRDCSAGPLCNRGQLRWFYVFATFVSVPTTALECSYFYPV